MSCDGLYADIEDDSLKQNVEKGRQLLTALSQLRIQLKLNTALLSTVRPSVCSSQARHLTFLTYIKA